MNKNFLRAAAVAILLAAVNVRASAYVEALYPLQQVLAESFVIAEGKVESHDPAKKIAAIKVGKSLKGKCTYDVIRVTYGGGQFWHPEGIPKHFVKDAPVLIFYNEGRQAEVYLNRFFIQLYGDAGAPPDKAWWSMTHIEIRMNRTFNGTVEELTDTVAKCLAGKMKPPPPDPKIPPIDLKDAKALPAFGEKVDEATLPLPFRKYDPNAKVPASAVAVNAEGFVQRWLTLGPVALGAAAGDHNAVFSKEWIPGQKGIKPNQNDKASPGGTEFSWQVADSNDFYLDLGSAENSMILILSYLTSEEEVKDASMLTGSDDSGAWWLNGEEVQRYVGGRGCAKDQDKTAKPVTLKKGLNVLVGAIVNGGGPTGACARFVNKAGQPVVKLTSGAEPPK